MKTTHILQKPLALWLLVALVLSGVFALYLQPDIMLALDGFWAMCAATLR